METKTNTALSISSARSLAVTVERLSDAELLTGTRRLVGRSNQLLAELVAHLAEVEARGIHRARACSSLYTYCIYELRFSEDEAFRRVAAARLVRRFPALLDALATGELQLTGLLLLGPHLTEQNLTEVLARSKHRTKREITRLVRVLDPLPAVPARIEPLGPAPARVVPSTPTWEEFTAAACPVRELEPGERPRDWLENEGEPDEGTSASGESAGEAAVHLESRSQTTHLAAADAEPVVPGPERYKVQFTANEEYVKLVEEAKALLSHSTPHATLDLIHLQAMREFVARLKKQKYATTKQSKASVTCEGAAQPQPAAAGRAPVAPPVESSASEGRAEHPRQRDLGRHIPAAVRREVAARDDERCTYVDGTGRRCPKTHRVEFHHLTPFARGGTHHPSNVTLRCRAHNDMAADADFGAEFVARKKAKSSHEPFSRQR